MFRNNLTNNKMNILKKAIEYELIGVYSSSLKIDFSSLDIMKVKGWIAKKAKQKTGYEQDFYCRISSKVTKENILEISKEIDMHIYKKGNKSKLKFTTESNENSDEQNVVKDEVKVNITTSQEKEPNTKPIKTIKKAEKKRLLIPETIRNILSKYTYIELEMQNIIVVYLKDKKEYDSSLNELHVCYNLLQKSNIHLKVNVIDRENSIGKLSKEEKEEFKEFFLKY